MTGFFFPYTFTGIWLRTQWDGRLTNKEPQKEESNRRSKKYGVLTQNSPYLTFLRFLVRQSAVRRKSEHDLP